MGTETTSALETRGFYDTADSIRRWPKDGRTKFTELMTHHTALVYEVINSDEVVLIHQNTGYTGRKVGTSKLRFSTIVKGSYKIYRPESN